MLTRRGLLSGLLTGTAALAGAAAMAPGLLPSWLSPEEVEEMLLVTGRVEWGGLEAGGVTVEVFNPHMHPVVIDGAAWGAHKGNGGLYVTRLEIQSSDGYRSVWTR